MIKVLTYAGSAILIVTFLFGLAAAARLLFKSAVVRQANEVVQLLQAQIDALKDEVTQLRERNVTLDTTVNVLREQVSGAKAVSELQVHLDHRLDEIIGRLS